MTSLSSGGGLQIVMLCRLCGHDAERHTDWRQPCTGWQQPDRITCTICRAQLLRDATPIGHQLPPPPNPNPSLDNYERLGPDPGLFVVPVIFLLGLLLLISLLAAVGAQVAAQ